MPRRSCFEDQKLERLVDAKARYESAVEKKQTKKFIDNFVYEYHQDFPPTNEINRSLEAKRIKEWFNNHTGVRSRCRVIKRRSLEAAIHSLITDGDFKNPKRKKKLSLVQSYSELFWDKRLKGQVELGFKAECAANPTMNHKDDYIAFQNRRLQEMYEEEDDEIKAMVEENRNAIDLDVLEDVPLLLEPGEESLSSDEQERRSNLRKRARMIINIETMLCEIARQVELETDMKVHFVMGGPATDRGGHDNLITVETGRTKGSKKSFSSHHKHYKNAVTKPFKNFLSECFTQEFRDSISLIPTVNSDSLSTSNGVSTSSGPLISKPIKKKKRRDGESSGDSSSNEDEWNRSSNEEDGDVGEEITTFPEAFNPHEVVRKLDSGSFELRDGSKVTAYELERLENIARIKKLTSGALDAAQQAAAALKPRPKAASHTHGDPGASAAPQRKMPARAAKGTDASLSFADEGHGTADAAMLNDLITFDECNLPDERSPSSPPRTNLTLDLGAVDEAGDDRDGDLGRRKEVVPLLNTSSVKRAEDPSEAGERSLGPDDEAPEMATRRELDETQMDDADDLDAGEVAERADDSAVLGVHDTQNYADVPVLMDNDSPSSSEPISANTASTSSSSSSSEDAERKASVARFRNNNILFPAIMHGLRIKLDTLDIALLPEWLREPIAYLALKFRGEGEDTLLKLWVTAEVLWVHSKIKHSAISAANRPSHVSEWFKARRIMSNIPPLDLATFPSLFRAWWTSLQPDWRQIEGMDWPLGRETPEGETWVDIRKPGKTGFIVVVLLLFWWRTAATSEPGKSEYVSALEDVCFVLECMLAEEDREGAAYGTLSSLARKRTVGGGPLFPAACIPGGGKKRKVMDIGPARSMRMRTI